MSQLGARLIAGVDEVGRGSLFGPVVAAAVILDPEYRVRGLRDSKLLPAERREVLAERIREHAVAWAVAAVDAARIDQINIYQASRLAMREAVPVSTRAPTICWSTRCAWIANCRSNPSFTATPCPLQSRPRRSWPRSARDQMIVEWDPVFPVYGLASNKGYSTPRHLAALREHGPSPLHRQSFAPVWNAPVPQDVLAFMLEDDEELDTALRPASNAASGSPRCHPERSGAIRLRMVPRCRGTCFLPNLFRTMRGFPTKVPWPAGGRSFDFAAGLVKRVPPIAQDDSIWVAPASGPRGGRDAADSRWDAGATFRTIQPCMPRMMVVTAHPDDEASSFGGSLCLYHERGCRDFRRLPDARTSGHLSRWRAQRSGTGRAPTRGICRRLRHFESLASATVLDYPDGQLHRLELQRVVSDLTLRIREFRPQVLLTFDAAGGVDRPHRSHHGIGLCHPGLPLGGTQQSLP